MAVQHTAPTVRAALRAFERFIQTPPCAANARRYPVSMAIVISHLSALRAIRRARRAYSCVPWDNVTPRKQDRVLASSTPGFDAIDFDALEALDAWNKTDEEPLDLLLSCARNRRATPDTSQHVLSPKLPRGSIMHVEADIYCTSPAFTALLCSRGASVAMILMMLMELLGTYCLPPEATYPIAHNEVWPDPDSATPDFGLDAYATDTAASNQSAHQTSSDSRPVETRFEQTHYGCDPAVTIRELETISRFAKSSSYANFRTAVKLARPGSASPAESLMFAVLGAPMRFGGFNCCSLPKGGLLLNHRVDFDSHAVNMSSGIPYAICDLYCPAARVDNEYNGIGHEFENVRIHDGNRNNGLKAMGIHVLVINRDQMKDLVALEAFAMTMHRLAGVQFRYRIDAYRTKQAAWLNELRSGIGLAPV